MDPDVHRPMLIQISLPPEHAEAMRRLCEATGFTPEQIALYGTQQKMIEHAAKHGVKLEEPAGARA